MTTKKWPNLKSTGSLWEQKWCCL